MNGLCQGQSLRPFAGIDVSAHCDHGSDRPQGFQDFRCAHIPGVKNQVRTAKCSHGLSRSSPCVSDINPRIFIAYWPSSFIGTETGIQPIG